MMTPCYRYSAIVASIYDGDTIRADIDLGFGCWVKNAKLRLAGIDTPEIRGGARPAGLAAKEFVSDRIPAGSEIIIVTDKDRTGKYGRYIATIFYDGGQNLNEQLVESGHAVVY